MAGRFQVLEPLPALQDMPDQETVLRTEPERERRPPIQDVGIPSSSFIVAPNSCPEEET